MKSTYLAVALCALCALCVCTAPVAFATGQSEAPAGPVSLQALTIGPGPVPVTRAQNLEEAARQLTAEGRQIGAEVTFSTQKFDAYRTSFSLAYRSGSAPDVLGEDQDILPEYAEEGMLLPLDGYVQAAGWQQQYKDFLPGLWDAVSWRGKIYGLPIEGVVNCLFYRKDVLRRLGMSDADMERLFSPDGGQYTLQRLVDLAARARDAGLVEWGFTHRRGGGDYWFNSLMFFGAQFVDPATGALVVDTQALRQDLEFHKMLVDRKLLPPDMASWDWKVIHKYSVEGRALFWIGGHSGQWKEYQDVEYHEQLGKLSEEYLQQNMGIAPFPGLKGPVTPVKVHAYSVVSTSKSPDAAFELISRAASPQLLARHAVTTFRGPARQSVADLPEFKEQRFLSRVLEIMRYSQAFPKHPALGKYGSMVFEAMSGVETGRLSVAQALDFVVAKAKADIPGVLIR